MGEDERVCVRVGDSEDSLSWIPSPLSAPESWEAGEEKEGRDNEDGVERRGEGAEGFEEDDVEESEEGEGEEEEIDVTDEAVPDEEDFPMPDLFGAAGAFVATCTFAAIRLAARSSPNLDTKWEPDEEEDDDEEEADDGGERVGEGEEADEAIEDIAAEEVEVPVDFRWSSELSFAFLCPPVAFVLVSSSFAPEDAEEPLAGVLGTDSWVFSSWESDVLNLPLAFPPGTRGKSDAGANIPFLLELHRGRLLLFWAWIAVAEGLEDEEEEEREEGDDTFLSSAPRRSCATRGNAGWLG